MLSFSTYIAVFVLLNLYLLIDQINFFIQGHFKYNDESNLVSISMPELKTCLTWISSDLQIRSG